MGRREKVSVARCAATCTDEQLVQATEDAIRQLGDYGSGLRGARKVAVKTNAGTQHFTQTDGKETEMTDPAVVEGVVRAIRAVTDAEIVLGDAPTGGGGDAIYGRLGYARRLERYGRARIIDFGYGEMTEVEMRHPGAMFQRYWLHRELADADAFVSVAKMKSHASMGCTLCIKNLFGWTPWSIYGSPRMYLHDRLIRLPHVLADLAAWARPCLNVVDGVVAASMQEWGGMPMRPGVLVAGTNVVATDHVAARLMGFDPQDDYPRKPFFYRRNAIVLAADLGIGPNDPGQVEVIGPCPEDIQTAFDVKPYDGDTRRDEQLLAGLDCVEDYRARQRSLARRHAGRYLAMRDGQILWDGADMAEMMRRERASGRGWQDAPQLVVRCVPPDEEIEQFEWYAFDAPGAQASLAA